MMKVRDLCSWLEQKLNITVISIEVRFKDNVTAGVDTRNLSFLCEQIRIAEPSADDGSMSE